MAWEWSHTVEAYWNARENLDKQTHVFLAVALAEWQGSRQEGYRRELSKRYIKSERWAMEQPDDILADMLWERAEEQRTCDNGGFDAWICPFGCHTVSFSCESVAT